LPHFLLPYCASFLRRLTWRARRKKRKAAWGGAGIRLPPGTLHTGIAWALLRIAHLRWRLAFDDAATNILWRRSN